jgi:hypothetical protein
MLYVLFILILKYNDTEYTILEEKVVFLYKVLYLEPLEIDLLDISLYFKYSKLYKTPLIILNEVRIVISNIKLNKILGLDNILNLVL